MKKIQFRTFTLFFLVMMTTIAQAQTWHKTLLGGPDVLEGDAVQTPDGGFIFTGLAEKLVRKVDAFGTEEWMYGLSADYNARSTDIELLPDGNVAVAGFASLVGSPLDRFHFIIKIDQAGTVIWEELYAISPPAQTSGIRLAVTDDAFYLGGRFDFLLKADLDGNEIWRRTTADFDPKDLAPATDGGVVMVVNNSSSGDLEIRKVHPDGFVEWTQAFGLMTEVGRSVFATSDGGFIALAVQAASGTSDANHFVVKTDGDGILEWQTAFGDPDFNESGNKIIQTSDGGYLVAGADFAFNYAMSTLTKLDASGNVLWETEQVRGDNFSVFENADGGHILFTSNWASNAPMLIRTGPDGVAAQNTITGRLINDINFDCEVQIMEAGLAGWEVWAMGPQPFSSGPFDVISFTDSEGNFSIAVDTGTYEIRIVPPHNGWENCNPPADVVFATSPESFDVGDLLMQENPVATHAVSGQFFQDLDGDCEFDPGEPGIPNATMQAIEWGGDYTLFSTLTDADGNYNFNLPENENYFVYFAGDPSNATCFRCGDTLSLFPLSGDVIFNTGVQCTSDVPQNIQGQFFIDENMDCEYAMTEPDFFDWSFKLVEIGTTDTIFRTVEDFYPPSAPGASFDLLVDTGQYFLEIISLHPLYQPCQSLQTLDIGLSGIPPLFIPVMAIEECPLLSVGLGTPLLRVCAENTYYVNYCNEGNLVAEDAYVEIMLPPDLSVTSASLPFSQSGPLLSFEIGNVEPDACGNFNFKTFLDCDSQVGETHCMEAHIFPDSTCATLNAQWDGSEVELSADCVDDMLVLTVTNAGWGDMGEAIEVLIVEDNVLIRDTSVQLVSGASEMLTIFPNGATIVVEARQTPGHPSQSLPVVTFEGCGGEEISLGFVTQYSQGNYDGFIAIDCRESVAAFDPNIKEAQPKGITDQHYIRPETELDYQITFQNLGTDTAFEVVILDTLSQNLDTATFRPGASSHVYEWEILEENILRFSFPNIELPHADVDEEGSIGFVKFRLGQTDGNGPGTLIENRAGIYFDFNSPVITNTVTHRIPEPQMFEYQTIVLCEGEEYNGQIFTGNTTLYDTTNYLFFDSIWVTDIQVLPLANSNQTAVICEGESYPFGGEELTEAGEYEYLGVGANGCDSTAFLTLDVLPQAYENIEAQICEGDFYEFGGEMLSESGEYTDTAPGTNGCDSTTLLTLTVLPMNTSMVDTLVLPGTIIYDVEITSDTIFTVIIPDAHDCDMEVTVNAGILVSTNEINAPNSVLEIIPNPNNGQFILRGNISNSMRSSVFIRNIYGQNIVTIWEAEKINGTINQQVDVGDLPSGIYFVEWRGEGWLRVSKLMVE